MSTKLFVSLAAAATLFLSATPAMAGGELPARVCPPPAPVCQTGPKCDFLHTILYYVPNRVLDLVDICRVSIGFGCGFDVNVRLTELAEIGFGQYESIRFGHKGRVMPVFEQNINEGGFAFLGYVNGCLQRDPTEIGADVFLGVIGVEVAASLAEAVDFLAGIVLLDPQGDDLGCNPWD